MKQHTLSLTYTMKKNLLSIVPLLEMLLLGSLLVACSNPQGRFAKEIPGVWQGTPETFTENGTDVTASAIETYEFGPAVMTANETLSGPITITGMVNTTTQIVADSSLIEPVALSAAAHTTVSGTWTVVDDNGISISLDLESLMVAVDPDGVMVNTSPLINHVPAVDSMRPAVASNIERSLKQALITRYAGLRHMDDVRIDGKLLKYEIGSEDFVLTRLSTTE